MLTSTTVVCLCRRPWSSVTGSESLRQASSILRCEVTSAAVLEFSRVYEEEATVQSSVEPTPSNGVDWDQLARKAFKLGLEQEETGRASFTLSWGWRLQSLVDESRCDGAVLAAHKRTFRFSRQIHLVKGLGGRGRPRTCWRGHTSPGVAWRSSSSARRHHQWTWQHNTSWTNLTALGSKVEEIPEVTAEHSCARRRFSNWCEMGPYSQGGEHHICEC